MELNIEIDCEVSDETIREDIINMLELVLPYMCGDKVIVRSKTERD